MKFELKQVQIDALRASNGAEGFAFYMEMGLGKTLTALAEFVGLLDTRSATRMFVGCPNSFKTGWVDEAAEWGIDLDFFVWNAGDEDALARWMRKEFKKPPCIIANYEAIRSEKLRALIKTYCKDRRVYAVWDESIQLKAHDSLQTKAAIELEPHFAYKRLLSGKYITQGPHDLWGQMRAIGALKGKNYYAFKTAFCLMGGFKMKQVIGAQNEEILAQLINPYIFRATKSERTGLPPKSHTIREYKLSPEMLSMYRQMEDEFVLWLESSGEEVVVDAAITKYIKLAQIQAGFIIKDDRTVVELVPPMSNPRVKALVDILENEATGKVLIPYHHRYTFEILYKVLAKYNPAYIRGRMLGEEIDEQKRRFNRDHDCRVMLLQTRASKYGHTLLGDQRFAEHACNTMVFFENTYSLDDRSQIEDRNHRHGQLQDSVLYVDLVGTSIDRNAVIALQRKESVFQAISSALRRVGSTSR